MKLSELKPGDRFRLRRGGMVWIKISQQGMHNQLTYCKSSSMMKQRNTHMNYRHRYVESSKEVLI